jgi:hypothetical protein
MKLTKDQMREAIVRIYGLLCAGDNEADILDEMGISADEYENLKSAMFEAKTEEIRSRPIEHIYIQYIIDQMCNMTDLDNVVLKYQITKQPTALVGAIRARSEILDKIIAKGQEFGILKKVPGRTEVLAGIVIAELSDNQLKKEIVGSLGALNILLGKYGDKNIIDVTPGSICHGAALPEAVLGDNGIRTKKINDVSKQKSKHRDKVRAGRRVVKR